MSAGFWHRQDWVGSTEGMSYSWLLSELLAAKDVREEMHAHNPSTREVRQEDREFMTCPAY